MSEPFGGRTAAADDELSHWPIEGLIDHILLTHHAYVRSALPRIAGYLTTLTEAHGARHPELARIAAAFDELTQFERDLHRHIHLEDNVLFPLAVDLESSRRW